MSNEKHSNCYSQPHECLYCGKRFGLNEELIVHLRVHGENKMFKCSICDDEFIEHCYLKSHMRIHDMKTAGNKSVYLIAKDINVDEPTCLVSVNGDVNVLESIVLKKRPHFNKSKNGHRRRPRRRDKEQKESDKQPNSSLTEEQKHLNETPQKDVVSVEKDVKDFMPNGELPQIFANGENIVKTEIKEEFTSIEDPALPFVDVSIKVEPGDLSYPDLDHENEDSSNQSNLDFFSQSFDSDSDDGKPLIQRIDWKKRLQIQFGNNTTNPMDKFKDIIESSFPVVLVERLQCTGNFSGEVEVKNEVEDDTYAKSNGIKGEPLQESMDIKPKKHVKSLSNDEKQNRMYKCSHCSKEVKTWPNLIVHEQTHQKSFECPTCKMDCISISNLIKHTKENVKCSRRNESNYMCSMCDNGIRYRNQAALNYHVTKHTGLRPFVCDVCNKTFRSKETLRQHMDRHNSVSNYNCEVCGRGFPNKNHLNQHQLSHTDLKPFRCDICNNFFKSQGRLYNHKKIHMKPQYSCCYCSKEFTIIGNLKIHEKRHMSSELVDKFTCEICQKQFILKHDLRYHMRKHNVIFLLPSFSINCSLFILFQGERPYPCSLCPSRFADISNLHKHIKIHTGDKPFVCHCGKSYNQVNEI